MNGRQSLKEEAAELKREVFELESSLAQKMALARVLTDKAEDLAGRAETEIRRREFRTYTEAQVAEIFQVSEDTIFRLRKEGRISHSRLGSLIRYTHEHLAEIADAMEKPSRTRAAQVSRHGRRL